MKCTVSPIELSNCLNLVARAVSTRSTLPILSNVLLETTENGLQITATNLDLSITVTVAAKVTEDGRTTVPARLLSEYVASLSDEPCTIEVDQEKQIMKLTSGLQRTNIHGISAAEFPPLPIKNAGSEIEVESTVFENAVAQTAMAASNDEASPVLTGVLLQIDGSTVTLAATDRHRLAVKTLEAKQITENGQAEVTTSVIVPARHLQEVARAVNSNRTSVKISLSQQNNQIFFNIGEVEISSRLIEGNYPNYNQVIPEQSSTTVSLPTMDLLRGAKTASVLARDSANPVRIRIGSGKVTLAAQTAEVGDHEAPLSADISGEDVQIAFNARYVLDALNAVDADEVRLSFNGDLSPGVIRPVGSDDYLCIIMPVKVPV